MLQNWPILLADVLHNYFNMLFYSHITGEYFSLTVGPLKYIAEKSSCFFYCWVG